MKLQELLQWQPGGFVRTSVVVIAAVLILGVSYLDTLTGLAYELHVLFPLPVVFVAWFVGARAGYGFALLAGGTWFLADRMLEGETANRLPLLFNTGMRMTLFFFGVWLISTMRLALERETRLAEPLYFIACLAALVPKPRVNLTRFHGVFA